MVRHTLAVSHKGSPVVIYGVSFMYIPAHQSQTSLMYTLKYLRNAKEDCVVLVSMPSKPVYSPQPWKSKYYTLLPINGKTGADRGPIGAFTAATLHTASREGQSGDMATRIKVPPCFGSSKWPKTELIEEPVLVRGPLWKNADFIEHHSNTIVCGRTGQPLCQELFINLGNPASRVKYTHTSSGCVPPLTVMVCTPHWENYFDLGETMHQMVKCLKDEDLEGDLVPRGDTAIPKDNSIQIIGIPYNVDTILVPKSSFPGQANPLTCP